ncbi:YqeB family protein [Streptomyces celluloflavus]|uniref:YqeB family protein n=1 Tax=Streptomyces celluloflavus TaxID=58344 RepID=UPI003657279C
MSAEKPAPQDATPIAPSTRERVLVWTGFPLLGAGVGWLLKMAVGWLATLSWVPWQGPVRLVASIPEPYAAIGFPVLGAVLGVLIACYAEFDYVTATVAPGLLTVTHAGRTRTVPRAAVDAVFLDGKKLVLLGHRSEEVARIGGDFDPEAFAAALQAHGYPWHADGDPHADAYRRWVDGLPDLPAAAHVLLKARAHALKKDRTADAEQLREELAELGIVVREEKKQQYWRPLPEHPGDGRRQP